MLALIEWIVVDNVDNDDRRERRRKRERKEERRRERRRRERREEKGADYVEYMDPGTMKYRVDGIEGLKLDDQPRIFIRNFVSDILNGTNHPPITLAEHKKTQMAQNAGYDSIYSGQPVKLQY